MLIDSLTIKCETEFGSKGDILATFLAVHNSFFFHVARSVGFSLMYLDISKSKLKCIFPLARMLPVHAQVSFTVSHPSKPKQSPSSYAFVLHINPPLYTVCHEQHCAGISDLEMHIPCKQAEVNKPHLHPVVDVVVYAQYTQCLRRKWAVNTHLSQFWTPLE